MIQNYSNQMSTNHENRKDLINITPNQPEYKWVYLRSDASYKYQLGIYNHIYYKEREITPVAITAYQIISS